MNSEPRQRLTRIFLFCCAGMLAMLSFITAVQAAEPLAVVTHPASSINALTREEVAALFMGLKRGIGSAEVVVLDMDDDAARQKFYSQVTHRSLIQIRAYWAKMVFTGNGRPPASMPLDKLMEKLRSDPYAIGYLPASKSGEFKVLLTLPD